MPRVHFVKKARKDNPAVKKGESYYHWQRYRSAKQYSKTPPRRSQLTSSGKLAQIYDAEDSVTGLGLDTTNLETWLGSIQNVEGAVREAGEVFRQVGEEYNESADNLEEYFSGSSQIDDIHEKANACEEAADACDNWADELSDQHTRGCELEEVDEEFRDQYPDESDNDYEMLLGEHEDEYETFETEFNDVTNEAENTLGEFEGPQL